jgi:hypothetical protein
VRPPVNSGPRGPDPVHRVTGPSRGRLGRRGGLPGRGSELLPRLPRAGRFPLRPLPASLLLPRRDTAQLPGRAVHVGVLPARRLPPSSPFVPGGGGILRALRLPSHPDLGLDRSPPRVLRPSAPGVRLSAAAAPLLPLRPEVRGASLRRPSRPRSPRARPRSRSSQARPGLRSPLSACDDPMWVADPPCPRPRGPMPRGREPAPRLGGDSV